MSDSLVNTSRRDMLQKMMATIAGISIFPSSLLAADQYASSTEETKDKQLQPFYIPPSAPLQPGPGGVDIRTLIHSSQTNKQFSCVEFAVAAKKMGPSPHYHKQLDELMYVVEGTATVWVEDTVYEIPAGGWHFRPRKMVHTFFNNTDKSFRGIDMYFNQNFEDYLEELYHQILPEAQAKHLSRKDPAIAKRIEALHDKFGLVGYPEKKKAIVDKYGLIE